MLPCCRNPAFWLQHYNKFQFYAVYTYSFFTVRLTRPQFITVHPTETMHPQRVSRQMPFIIFTQHRWYERRQQKSDTGIGLQVSVNSIQTSHIWLSLNNGAAIITLQYTLQLLIVKKAEKLNCTKLHRSLHSTCNEETKENISLKVLLLLLVLKSLLLLLLFKPICLHVNIFIECICSCYY